MKLCSQCGKSQSIDNFFFVKKSTGLRRSNCKSCVVDNLATWRRANPEKYKAQVDRKRAKHRDSILAKQKIYEAKNAESIKVYRAQYYQDNKKRIIARDQARLHANPMLKLRKYVSKAIRDMLNDSGSKKGLSCLQYLSYSIEELKSHIETQFQPWMNWNNRGNYNPKTWNDADSSTWTWQLDHIIPQSKLPYSSMSDDNFKKCWALSNLRPYSSKQNLKDGANR